MAVAVFATAVVMIASASGGAAAAAAFDSRAAVAGAGSVPLGTEQVGLRTERSRTWARADGTRVTRIDRDPVNVLDASGQWQPIDNRLRRSAGRWVNGVGRYRLELPERIGNGPLRVEAEGRWVSLAPRGLRSSVGAVEGSRATFADVAEGVTLRWTAGNGAVKEDLLLAHAEAANSFQFALRASDGLGLRPRADGSIAVIDVAGKPAFVLAAPVAYDAKGAVSPAGAAVMSAQREAGGWRVTLRLAREWLQAPERAFPVALDPTIHVGLYGILDCTIWKTQTSSMCSRELAVGREISGEEYRALLKFDVSNAVPAGAEIVSAHLQLLAWAGRDGDSDMRQLGAYRVTQPWTSDASWTMRTASSSWTTAGGDVATPVEASVRVPQHWDWARWDITRLARGWIEGDIANHGVLLRDDGPGDGPTIWFLSSETDTYGDSGLYIVYEPRGGVRRGHAYDTYELTDRSSLSVNVADGNLLLSSQDLEITGTGLDLSMQRFYNSRDGATGELGQGGRFSIGRDVELEECVVDGTAQSRCMIAPSGFRARFEREADGGYKTPPGMNATLKRNGDGTFTLTDHRSGQKMHFLAQASSYMSSIEDRHDNRIRFAYTANGLLKITDTQGRTVNATLNANGDIATITDPTSRQWRYDYHSGTRRLWKVTAPDGTDTEYYYDPQGRLTSIIDPRGSQILIGYDAQQRVASIKRQVSDNRTEDVTTTYVYGSPTSPCDGSGSDAHKGKTVLTDPRGKATTYCWDSRGRVRKTEDADGNRRSKTYTSNDDVATFTDLEGTAAGTFQFNYDSSTNNLAGGQGAAGEVFGIGYCGQTAEPACHAYEQAQHQPTSVTSPNGSKTHMSYNASGDMVRMGASTAGAANSVDLEYRDGSSGEPDDGQLEWAEDGRDNRTTFGYDANGNLNEIDPPGSELGKTTFTHDALSRVTSVRDGRHQNASGPKQIQSIGYDGVDRVKRVDYGDGSWFAFSYDPNGNLASRSDSFGNTTTYVYDRRNLRLSEDLPGTAFNGYTYDAAGNLATLTDAGGTVSYGYDNINRVTSVTQPGGATIMLAYNDDDRHSTITFPGGIWQRTHTDKSHKTTSMVVRNASGTLLRQLDYDYDDNAFCAGTTTAQRTLVQKVTDHNNRTTCYEYDVLDRLSYTETRNSAGSLVESFDYDFDGASNRTKKVRQTTSGSSTTSYAYNSANQLCWRAAGNHASVCGSPPAGATDYDYDESGNEIDEQGGRASTYDIRNRLVNVSGTAFGYLTATNGELISVGAIALQNNLLGLGRQDSTSYTRTPEGAVLGQRGPSSTEYYLRDRLDSTIGLVSGTTIVRDYSYDPDGNASTTGTGATTNIRFAGGHTTNGLYHFGARYYDPQIGRWTQPDPLQQPGDVRQANRYTYAGANAVNFVDPTGDSFLGLDDFGDVAETAGEIGATAALAVGTVAVTALGTYGTYMCFTTVGLVDAPHCLMAAAATYAVASAGTYATANVAAQIPEDN